MRTCKRCGRPEKHSYAECLRYPSKHLSVTAAGPRPGNLKVERIRVDAETIIQEYGVGELSKTAAGRSVIENARQKYRTELIQPSDPSFNAYYGKEVKQRERDMAELRAESQRLKREAGMS